MQLFLTLLILILAGPLWAQETPEEWIAKIQKKLPGSVYIAGETTLDLLAGRGFGKNINLVVIGELPTVSEMSRLAHTWPIDLNQTRLGHFYQHETGSILRVREDRTRVLGRFARVKPLGLEVTVTVKFFESLEKAQSHELFNVKRALLPVEAYSSSDRVDWGKVVDPEKAVESWQRGEIRTLNWKNAIADPISWALEWATLIVEQGRGAKLSFNGLGPSMGHVIETFAKENRKITEEQRESLRRTFLHPAAPAIFEVLQSVEFFKMFIPHKEMRKIMQELRINPWARKWSADRSERPLSPEAFREQLRQTYREWFPANSCRRVFLR